MFKLLLIGIKNSVLRIVLKGIRSTKCYTSILVSMSDIDSLLGRP